MKLTQFISYVFILITALYVSGCQKEGCTDFFACNYDSDADEDDGSCYYNCGGGNGNSCNYTNWTGTGSCANSGYYPVYTGKCCSSSYPYYNTASNMCYTSCSSAEGANTLGSVYRINDGSGTGGGGGTGGGSGSCPSMGRFAVKIYTDPKTGGCPGNSINHTLRFYYCCAHGQSSNSVAAGIWSYGQDAGGSYMTGIFGNETTMLCAHGTTLYKRLYRFEWEVTPKTLSYPNTCILSGATNIDYQDQLKSVVIDWQ